MKSSAVLAAVIGLGITTEVSASAAPPAVPEKVTPTSSNGWPLATAADIGEGVWTKTVVGTLIDLPIRIGHCQTLLAYVIQRFSFEIDVLRRGDVTGFIDLSALPSGQSNNLASGTAILIRSGKYPVGTGDGFTIHELRVIRSILDDLEGVVVWGGDLKVVNEALFEIAVPPLDPSIDRVARKIAQWDDLPGFGAGSRNVGG